MEWSSRRSMQKQVWLIVGKFRFIEFIIRDDNKNE